MLGFQNLKCILLNDFYVCGPSSLKLIPHLVYEVRKYSGRMVAKGTKLLELIGFQILPFLKIFVTDFSEAMKARKLKLHINMDKDSMYSVYWNRGQWFITLVFSEFLYKNIC